MSGYGAVILHTQHQHAAIGIREGGHVFRDLFTYLATSSRALRTGRALVHRLAVEVLTLVLGQERGDVELSVGHSIRG